MNFRYLLVRAALAILAFCSSSRPAELQDVTFGQVLRDSEDRGIWFRKIHAKNKKGEVKLKLLIRYLIYVSKRIIIISFL